MEKEIGAYSSPSDSEQPESEQFEKADIEGVTTAPSLRTPAADPETEPDSGSVIEKGALPAAAAAAAAAAKDPHSDVPEGGLQAWLQVLGSWVVLAEGWGLINSFGVFQTYYETELLTSSSGSSISWIGSLQASLLMFVGVLAGPLYDAGYFRVLLVAGHVLIVLGMFMTSLCTAYWQVLLAQGITMGLGMGLTFLPSTAVLAQYFRRRRALAIGIGSTGSPIAGIVFPILFSRLQPAIGFGWATRVIAFILLGLSVVPVVFMRTRIPPSGRVRSLYDPTALRDVAYVLVIVAGVSSFLCLYVAFFYVQLFAEEHAIGARSFSPYIVTLLNVGSIFGRVVPNALADTMGSVNVALTCAAVSAVLLFGWLGIHNLGGLVVFALLYGLFSGGIVSIMPSVIMVLTDNMARVGARMGMGFAALGVSILVGTPIAGAILGSSSESEWLGMIGYSAAGLTLGTASFAAARIVLYRRKGGWRA